MPMTLGTDMREPSIFFWSKRTLVNKKNTAYVNIKNRVTITDFAIQYSPLEKFQENS